MKSFYSGILFTLFYCTAFAQTPAPDTILSSNVKKLFDYLLASSRLNISMQDNVTVLDLVNDAERAGYHIDTVTCSELRNNLRKPFYTLTPYIVRLPGLIVGAQDSSYRAMAGNIRLTFSAVAFPFEHKLAAFYSKKCSVADTVEYTMTKIATKYYKYTIRHYAQPGLSEWSVSYRDQLGRPRVAWLPSTDTLFCVYAVSVSDVIDADRINNVYAAGVYTIDEQSDPSYTVDQANYYRPTTAVLKIETGVGRGTATPGFVVKTGQNPSYNAFTLSVASAAKDRILIRLADVNGRTIESTSVASKSNVTVGSNIQPGIYYAEVISGNERKVIKLLKL